MSRDEALGGAGSDSTDCSIRNHAKSTRRSQKSAGYLEFLNGDYGSASLTENQTKVLKAVAEQLGIEYKLTFSLVAIGSGCERVSVRFDSPKEEEESTTVPPPTSPKL